MQDKASLLIVDVQNDFCPGGSLPVSEGDQIVPVLNECIDRFKKINLPIIASRDWHPEKTSHFRTYGGIWPPHCIQGTMGAEFHPDLRLSEDVVIISKGMDPEEDSYSGFQGTDARGVSLSEVLRRSGVKRLFVGGLATDYCVKSTVLDGLREGFEVVLLEAAIKAVNIQSGDSERAIEDMIRAGAERITGLPDFSSYPWN